MIKFIIILLLISNYSYSYDATIKDNRGRIISYLDKDNYKEQINIIDVRGRVQGYIEEEEIKDIYGSNLYYIEED